MHPEELNKVFNMTQPKTLPDHLGQNLPDNLKTWIRDVYGPAFTSLLISESYNTGDWREKFDDTEKEKISWFWQGRVSTRRPIRT